MQKTITFNDPKFKDYLAGKIDGKESETRAKVHLTVHSWLVGNIHKIDKKIGLDFLGTIDQKFLSKYGLVHRKFYTKAGDKQKHRLEKNGQQFGDELEISYYMIDDGQVLLTYISRNPNDIEIIEA